ncbi:beta-hydroxyacyl-ACP dehydratase [Serratia fonticola]|uniref:Beta-hydroxyacyl-ACP dehydratase n=2 Tax=Serratia fonticola TaxID=47917 RepID=A0AAW3WZU7_SERFO|nr:3-hydroxyacyl-ACP dehydratase FabZ family protein [Serratia fonticola]MBC3215887.1 beta-hydroxyacyl-ACP dehydratase [Serratia fonticola]NYA16410.1 beta-hydroxyacyl-ACP dehydratase [Serratia fonticola]NYA36549.1 beta-hydroxyacyl-ACP dehydratase [Serratia fonticola]
MFNGRHAKEVTDVSNDLVPHDIQRDRLKSNLLFSDDVANELTQPLDQRQIMKMIPHRAPFLLVDRVELVNLELGLIKAARKIDVDDPVFKGHFPDNPVYPGVLQQESMFQSALILMYFLLNKTALPPLDEQVTNAVGTRVYDVFHLAAVRPGDEMTIRCAITEYDSLIVTAIVQITVSDKVVTIGKGEFCVI